MPLLTAILVLFLHLAQPHLIAQPTNEFPESATSKPTNTPSNGGSPNKDGKQDDFIRDKAATFVIGVIIGFAGGWWANHLRTRSESHSRRREFRGFLRKHIQDFQSIEWKRLSDGKLFEIYARTIEPVSAECAKIYEDIRNNNRSGFQNARIAYCGLEQHDIEARVFTEGKFPPLSAFPDFEAGIKKMIGLLEELSKLSE